MEDNPQLFNSQAWLKKDTETLAMRTFVYGAYVARVNTFPWNEEESTCPIIAVSHGTDFEVAMSIAQKGFAALASLDEGFYGKGIYFTSYCLYTVPYITNRKQPAILISLANLGNPYPVTESHKNEVSLLGAAIKSGYQSHYVLTHKNGDVLDVEQPAHYDEVVISQESQVVPIYLLKLPSDLIKPLLKLFNKDSGIYVDSSSRTQREKGLKNLKSKRGGALKTGSESRRSLKLSGDSGRSGKRVVSENQGTREGK